MSSPSTPLACGTRGTSLAIGPGETAHFDSDDLESGDPDAGLAGGTGRGQGDWRLELTSDLAVEVQAYVRAQDGAFAEMRETAARDGDRFRIPTFNPGDNVNQVGLLWLFNRGDEPVTVRVRGADVRGRSPGPGVAVELGARGARTYTSAELESGAAPGLAGSLGDGVGKWRLDGEADGPVMAMSLVSSPTGHLTNLSTVPARESGGVHRVPLFPPASDAFGRQGFARVVNRSDVAGEVRIEAFNGTEWSYEAVTLAIGANETAHFNSNDLELGNRAKGLTGSTGAGEGDWRLELTSELDVEVLSYVRTVGGRGVRDADARHGGPGARGSRALLRAALPRGGVRGPGEPPASVQSGRGRGACRDRRGGRRGGGLRGGRELGTGAGEDARGDCARTGGRRRRAGRPVRGGRWPLAAVRGVGTWRCR